MQANNQAYDQAKTVFSPDGRLFQVEYAREAVKRGTTALGVRFKDGVALLVEKRIPSRLIEPQSIEKIFKLDHHVACATSGLVADARVLVARARVDAQQERITYGDRIPIPALVRRIGDFKQAYAQAGGVRPFGTALIVGGVDESGPHLYETDPSGATVGMAAACVGAARPQVMEILHNDWKPNMAQAEAVKLGLKALRASKDGASLTPENLEVAIVTAKKPFRHLDAKEIKKAVEDLGDEGAQPVEGKGGSEATDASD